MFSKIDETVDKVHIPYYDAATNEYTRFLPDFIFWMCKDDEYQIVFVDPKGTAHSSAYLKIDGYIKLFEKDNKLKEFKYRNPGARTGAAREEGNPVSSACITVRLLCLTQILRRWISTNVSGRITRRIFLPVLQTIKR